MLERGEGDVSDAAAEGGDLTNAALELRKILVVLDEENGEEVSCTHTYSRTHTHNENGEEVSQTNTHAHTHTHTHTRVNERTQAGLNVTSRGDRS